MTLTHIPQVAAYLWLASAFWQIVVALVVLRLPFRRTYPAFSSFACFAAVTTPILMVLPVGSYFLGFAIVSATTCVLLWAVLFELYTRVCGPRFSLPSWVPRTMASWLLLAIGASVAATVALYTVRSLPKRGAVLAAVQGGMLMALCLAVAVLLAYSNYLGMEWRIRHKQIVVGLAIYLSVSTVVLFLLNHVPREWTTLLDRIGQIAFVISLIWWTVTLRRYEPPVRFGRVGIHKAESNPTLEILRQMSQQYRSTAEIKERNILDSIIKNNCDITARGCKRVEESQEEDSPLYFAAYNTRREAIDLSRKCRRRGHTQDNMIPPEYDDFKDSVIHLFETTCLGDAAGSIPELL
jgi:hypothetical protein